MTEIGVSTRRACLLVKLNRSTYQYRRQVKTDEELLRKRLKELALQRPRFGSPRLTVLIRRELGAINHKEDRTDIYRRRPSGTITSQEAASGSSEAGSSCLADKAW